MTDPKTYEPVGALEIAGRLGVRRETVAQWKQRKLLPPARWTVSGEDAWDWTLDIEPWARETGRMPARSVSVMSGQESGLRQIRQEARTAGEVVTEYAQLDGNGVFLVWDSSPDGEARFPLAERIRIARSFGGLIFRRHMIVVENWEEVAEL